MTTKHAIVLCLCAGLYIQCTPSRPPTTPKASPDQETPAKKSHTTTKGQPTPKTTKSTTSTVIKPPTIADVKSKASAVRRAVNAGRKSFRAKRYDEAMAHFQAAIKIDTNNPRALAELGWAAFKAEKLKDAHRHTTLAIQFTKSNKLLGASYYNLGRIAEAQSNKTQAVAHYQISLKHRPNTIVAKRLSSIQSTTVAKPLCDWYIMPDVTKENLCELFIKKHVTEDEQKAECEGITKAIENPKDKTRAIIFTYRDHLPNVYSMLAIHSKNRWYIRELSYEYVIGMMGISETVTIEHFAFEQLVPGGASELRVRVHKLRTDSDLGINEYEHEESKETLVVDLNNTQPVIMMDRTTYSRDGRMFLIDKDEEEEGIKHTPGVPYDNQRGYILTFQPKTGQYTVRRSKKFKLSSKVGTFPLNVTRTQCAWPKHVQPVK